MLKDTKRRELVSVICDRLKDNPILLACVQLMAETIETTGLSETEAAMLARLSTIELEELYKEIPEIREFLKLKRLEHKKSLLKVLFDHATINKDIKISQYLLEKNFSEDFDSSIKKETLKHKKPEEANDVLQQLFSLVQSTAPNSPVTEAPKITEDEILEEAKTELSELVHG